MIGVSFCFAPLTFEYSSSYYFFLLHKLHLYAKTDKFAAYLTWGISEIENVVL